MEEEDRTLLSMRVSRDWTRPYDADHAICASARPTPFPVLSRVAGEQRHLRCPRTPAPSPSKTSGISTNRPPLDDGGTAALPGAARTLGGAPSPQEAGPAAQSLARGGRGMITLKWGATRDMTPDDGAWERKPRDTTAKEPYFRDLYSAGKNREERRCRVQLERRSRKITRTHTRSGRLAGMVVEPPAKPQDPQGHGGQGFPCPPFPPRSGTVGTPP
jgi:hypothetical protein